MQYLGIDWAYRRAAWCAKNAGGDVLDEGVVPADEDGLAKLVVRLGTEVRARVEMMSGAIWVRDCRPPAGGSRLPMRARSRGWRRWRARPTRSTRGCWPSCAGATSSRPSGCPPWMTARCASGSTAGVVRMRTMARNRIHGLLTQWGLKIPVARLRQSDGLALLETHGVPPVWRRSVVEALAVIDLLDGRLAPLEQELYPLARADARVALLQTIPGIGPLLGLTIAAEIGDIARFSSARKLVGYAGLAPKVKQSGQSSRTGALSKAGSKALRWAAVEAAQQAWRETNPWHQLYRDVARRHAKTNPAKAAVARKVLIAAWHVLSLQQPFKPCAARGGRDPVPASSHFHLAA
jgi:transposase